jgi:hypothetical protein
MTAYENKELDRTFGPNRREVTGAGENYIQRSVFPPNIESNKYNTIKTLSSGLLRRVVW